MKNVSLAEKTKRLTQKVDHKNSALTLVPLEDKRKFRLSSAVKIFDLGPKKNLIAQSDDPFFRTRPLTARNLTSVAIPKKFEINNVRPLSTKNLLLKNRSIRTFNTIQGKEIQNKNLDSFKTIVQRTLLAEIS